MRRVLFVLMFFPQLVFSIEGASQLNEYATDIAIERPALFQFELKQNESKAIVVTQFNADVVLSIFDAEKDRAHPVLEVSIPPHNFLPEHVFVDALHCQRCILQISAATDLDKKSTVTLFSESKFALSTSEKLINTLGAMWYAASNSQASPKAHYKAIEQVARNTAMYENDGSDSNELFKIRYLQAFSVHMQNDYAHQKQLLEQLTRDLPLDQSTLRFAVDIDLATLQIELGSVDMAKQAFDNIVSHAKDKNIAYFEAAAHTGLAKAYSKKGNVTRAIKEYKTALAEYKKQANLRAIISTYLSLGYLYRKTDDPKLAKEHLLQAKLLAQAYDAKRYEVQADISLATQFRLDGNVVAALYHGNQADRFSDQFPHLLLHGRVKQEKARLATQLGQFELAADYYEQAYHAYLSGSHTSDAINIDYFKSRLLVNVGRLNEAEQSAKAVLAYDLQHGRASDIGVAYNQHALIALRKGDKKNALVLQQQALDTLKLVDDYVINSGIYAQAGEVFFANGLVEEGERYYQHSFRLIEDSENTMNRLFVYKSYAQSLASVGNHEKAIEIVENLIPELLHTQSGFHRDDHKRSFLSVFQALTSLYIDSALKIERSEPTILSYIDALRAKSIAVKASHTTRSLKQEQYYIHALQKQFLAYSQSHTEDERNQILTTSRALVEGLHSPEHDSVALTSSSHSADKTNVFTLQERLPESSVVLFFDTGTPTSYVWIINSDSVHRVALPPAFEIAKYGSQLYKYLKHPSARQKRVSNAPESTLAFEYMNTLFDSFKPFVEEHKKLYIIPDGAFHYLPITTFLADRKLGVKSVSVFPSLSHLSQWLNTYPTTGRNLYSQKNMLVIADPAMKVSTEEQDDLGFRAVELPFSRTEMQSVIAKHKGPITTLSQDNASKNTLYNLDMNKYGLIHFATHGVSNSHSDALNGLVLSNSLSSDNVLLADEIRRMPINADLVVLSGCETAVGTMIDGDGLIGLSRAFFDAGARSVIASLWPVQDRATAALMAHFYDLVSSHNVEPSEALYRAQMYVKNYKKRNGHQPWLAPHYWAGFVFQGMSRFPE